MDSVEEVVLGAFKALNIQRYFILCSSAKDYKILHINMHLFIHIVIPGTSSSKLLILLTGSRGCSGGRGRSESIPGNIGRMLSMTSLFLWYYTVHCWIGADTTEVLTKTNDHFFKLNFWIFSVNIPVVFMVPLKYKDFKEWAAVYLVPLWEDSIDFNALMKNKPFIFSHLFHYLFVRDDLTNTSIAGWKGYKTKTSFWSPLVNFIVGKPNAVEGQQSLFKQQTVDILTAVALIPAPKF